MSETRSELTAFCGLYCGDCIRYRSKASDLARELLNELDKTDFKRYAEIKCSPARQMDAIRQFENYPLFLDVLAAITALQCVNPCRTGGGCRSFSCAILECCKKKHLEGCWQCAHFEKCLELDALKSIHGDSPRENLRKIKTIGIDAWADNRSKAYPWQ